MQRAAGDDYEIRFRICCRTTCQACRFEAAYLVPLFSRFFDLSRRWLTNTAIVHGHVRCEISVLLTIHSTFGSSNQYLGARMKMMSHARGCVHARVRQNRGPFAVADATSPSHSYRLASRMILLKENFLLGFELACAYSSCTIAYRSLTPYVTDALPDQYASSICLDVLGHDAIRTVLGYW